jgi:hypothetical protein
MKSENGKWIFFSDGWCLIFAAPDQAFGAQTFTS